MPRITGRHGAIYLGISGSPVKIADTINWELTVEQEAVACPIKGEVADPQALGGVTVRITAERISTNADIDAVLSKQIRANIPATGGSNDWNGVPVEYRLEQIDGGTQGAQVTGTGVIVRATLNAPRALANDTIEIMGTTLPTFT